MRTCVLAKAFAPNEALVERYPVGGGRCRAKFKARRCGAPNIPSLRSTARLRVMVLVALPPHRAIVGRPIWKRGCEAIAACTSASAQVRPEVVDW
jgi:hypothetical protein